VSETLEPTRQKWPHFRSALTNEAIAKTSPFRSGPLKGLPEVEEIVFDWVSWYNSDRLHSFLGNIPPEEYERAYYARTIGPSKGDAANKPAA
jgi:putative transposase